MYQAQGIIIRKNEYREADRIYTIYTKDSGKIKVLAKGVRKINAKLRAPLELLNYINFYFVQGKSFKIITGSELIDKFSSIKEDSERLKTGQNILRFLDESIKGEEKDLRIWDLLLEVLTNLNRLEGERPDLLSLISRYFELKLLTLLGFRPQLYQCVYCSAKIAPEKIFFSIKDGGLVCRSCFGNKFQLIEVTSSLVKILRVILERDWEFIKKLKITKSEEANLQKIIQYFRDYMVE